MKTASEIRLLNLQALVKEAGTLRALAESCNTSEAYLSQIMTGQPDSKTGKAKSVGDKLARKLEDGTKKSRGWMDAFHNPPPDRLDGIRDQRDGTDNEVSHVAAAIKAENNLDGMELIERGLRALVIVGRRKDEILRLVTEARAEAEETKAAILEDLRKRMP